MNWRERVTINPEICHGKAFGGRFRLSYET